MLRYISEKYNTLKATKVQSACLLSDIEPAPAAVEKVEKLQSTYL